MKKFKKFVVIMLTTVMLTASANAISASAGEENSVYLGGQPFGVKFYNDGVIVVELESFFDGKSYVCPSKQSGIKVNDIIKTVNGVEINSNEDLQKISAESGGKEMKFEIERGGERISKTVTPRKNTSGVYLLGAWVKDSCAGIGTVTYYDSGQNYFAALGHGICDSQTTALLPLKSAEVLGASISSVSKSVEGKPGSINGYFTDNKLGSLTKNTNSGVFGITGGKKINASEKLPLAQNNEAHTGEAKIYTTIDSRGVKGYDAEIKQIRNTDRDSNENFVIKVTDSRLIEKCGGIVQGMSGSPIVQNGKIIGAVTHVFMNKPDEGYGVLIQNMVSNYKE